MRINSVNPVDGPKNPGKGKVGGLPEASGKAFQNELRLSLLIISIKNGMAESNKEAALNAFKTILTFPGEMFDLAKRVFEGAPIFAAFVAKMAIDEMTAKFDLEKEKAGELQKLGEEYARRSKMVLPTQFI